MQLNDLKGRIARLERLSRGLALEAALVREGNDPLLYGCGSVARLRMGLPSDAPR